MLPACCLPAAAAAARSTDALSFEGMPAAAANAADISFANGSPRVVARRKLLLLPPRSGTGLLIPGPLLVMSVACCGATPLPLLLEATAARRFSLWNRLGEMGPP